LFIKFLVILIISSSSLFVYGFIAGSYEIFPYDTLRDIKREFIPQKLCGFHPEDFPQVYATNVSSLINLNSYNDIEQKRTEIFEYLWKNNTIHNSMPTKIIENISDQKFNMNNIQRIDKIIIEMDYGVNSIAYIFFPKTTINSEKNSNDNSLIIYHQGHKGDFTIYGKDTIEKLLENNYTVMAFSMPLEGQNNQPVIDIPNKGIFKMKYHNHFLYLDNPNFSSMKYFFEPIMKSLNYVEKNYSFEKFHMIGLSGGGWTTMVYSAIDPRISHSYAVSGGYPEYLQQMIGMGHYERNANGLLHIVNYPEMYVMSSVGENRKSVHISIEWDTGYRCGNFAQTYDKPVKESVKKIGPGTFKTYLDSSIIDHIISDESLSFILKELKDN
jgi:hypothetical protein